ncbi:hypothetical protein PVAG01_04952 [Phlyctema vagabunda]|uniref:Mediator complex subunit 11 n=1 Tax=Phlyctema vagabunda TaxID=108571 RepID=A0ABR4PIT1_9HELO
MPQEPRTKRHLDVLQSMINGILIETGRALRPIDKDGSRTLAPTNARLQSTLPSAVENFHQALDELESDIVRAKAVLGRDLAQIRAQRVAAEHSPVEVPEKPPKAEPETIPENLQAPVAVMTASQPAPEPIIKEEFVKPKSPEPTPAAPSPKVQAKEAIPTDIKISQIPSPPTSSVTDNSKPILPPGLGIDTSADSQAPAPSTGGIPDSSIDSLFDDLVEGTTNGDTDINFGDMDFSMPDPNTSTQNGTQSQAQAQEFDLSTFGENMNDVNLDFDMDTAATDNASGDKQPQKQSDKSNDLDDLFGMDTNTGAGDSMDLDMSMDIGGGGGGDDFDDLFFGMEDENMGGDNGSGELGHGDLDSFFGL